MLQAKKVLNPIVNYRLMVEVGRAAPKARNERKKVEKRVHIGDSLTQSRKEREIMVTGIEFE